MKVYIICGEASGDLHGANLMKAIKNLRPDAEFRFWGGDCMEAEGGYNVSHLKERAFMGISEVLRNIFKIRKSLALAKSDIASFKPDKLIFIDYPGFNLRIAEWAHHAGFETHYYISPKVWAWNTGRARKIKRIISHLYCILPFEVDFYQKFDFRVHYVGNPLMDALAAFKPDPDFRQHNRLSDKPLVAVLPGSRRQELKYILPHMLEAIGPFTEKYEFVLAMAPGFGEELYAGFKHIDRVTLVSGNTYNILAHSHAALVTSGTATLETGLFRVPQIVLYKTSKLNYIIGKQLVEVDHFSLVNLIANRAIVRELLQDELTPEMIGKELERILDGPAREQMLIDYEDLARRVGPPGASERTASLILSS